MVVGFGKKRGPNSSEKNLLLNGLLNPQRDWVADELRVFLDQILKPPLLEILQLVFLEVKCHLRSPAKTLTRVVSRHGERSTGLRLPHVLLIVVVLGGDNNLISNQISLGHPDTTVDDGQGVVTLVGDDMNEKLWLTIELALVGQGLEPNLNVLMMRESNWLISAWKAKVSAFAIVYSRFGLLV
ncbi:unnamed protein product [Thlaspi arvense]|uniref:Uncharacterized protein n=1 Tax=Thlaspi arvense TaxID=13288 RepID=A0AAU9RTS2_THLAR|nr:unnamed protein product [Thlaspi arvense]